MSDREIARYFGNRFTRALSDLPEGSWHGPIASSYGLHLVYVHERARARVPELSEIRAQVVNRTRQKLADDWLTLRLALLRKEYSDPANLNAGAVAAWEVSCEDGLVGRTLGVEGLDTSQTSALLRIAFADGRLVRRVLTATEPAFTVSGREGTFDVVMSYGGLGVEHIATGWDHLTFVLALIVLVIGRRRLIVTITAFTLGHSVTLALAVLGVVQVPQDLTEAVIALSIVVLAIELARTAMGGEPSVLSTKPWAMAGVFGLLHGLGFAGALSEIGLPDGEIPLALFSFNVGIELGQLGFIAVVMSLWALLRRAPFVLAWQPVRFVPAYAIGSVAAFWFIQRTVLVAQSWGVGG